MARDYESGRTLTPDFVWIKYQTRKVNLNVEGCCRELGLVMGWMLCGWHQGRRGSPPALCVKPRKEEAKLCSPGSGPGSPVLPEPEPGWRGQAPSVYGGQAVSRQLGSYPPLTNQRTSGHVISTTSSVNYLGRNYFFFMGERPRRFILIVLRPGLVVINQSNLIHPSNKNY